jgi:hypothetical protein
MSMDFGLYVTAIGVGLVFAALLAVAILSKVLIGVFEEKGEPVWEDGDEKKVAAVAAVIASMGEHPARARATGKIVSRWEAAARMEAMERGEER